MSIDDTIEACARDLFEARRSRAPIAPVRTRLPEKDIAAAYRVQQINVGRTKDAGERPIGRKIGLTSEAVQRQLGVDQPDFGVLFENMQFGADFAISTLIAPRIEAEFAFLLGADVEAGPVTADSVARAVKSVTVAAEIVDSAIANWDINIVDTVADNASCGAFVLGPWTPYAPGADLRTPTMRMTRDGVEISKGAGAATLGDPLNALAWLAQTSFDIGEPLRAGEVVLAGALGPMVALTPGDYLIEIDGFEPLRMQARP